MRLHGFSDDREAEAGTCRLRLLATPKAIKNALAVLQRHAASPVRDAHARTKLDGDSDFSTQRRVQHGILDEISNRVRSFAGF